MGNAKGSIEANNVKGVKYIADTGFRKGGGGGVVPGNCLLL